MLRPPNACRAAVALTASLLLAACGDAPGVPAAPDHLELVDTERPLAAASAHAIGDLADDVIQRLTLGALAGTSDDRGLVDAVRAIRVATAREDAGATSAALAEAERTLAAVSALEDAATAADRTAIALELAAMRRSLVAEGAP